MAGPTCSVLLRANAGVSTLALAYEVIDSIAIERNDNSFYVRSTQVSPGNGELRPFGVELSSITTEYDEHSADELISIQEKFKFSPNHQIALFAMCNQREDHMILAQLTVKIAEAVNGIIDFGGLLFNQKGELTIGKVYEINYQTANGKNLQYHVGDIEFLRNWIFDKDFHMIK